MIKILQSGWTASLSGLALYFVTTAVTFRPPPMPVDVPGEHAVSSGPKPSWEFQNPEMDQLIAELKKEKVGLSEKQTQLNELATRLQNERAELDGAIQSMQRNEQEFDKNFVRIRQEETVNLKRLAKLYSTMSPDSAAATFAEMENDAVVRVVRFMKETESAPILESLTKIDPKRTAAIFERMRLSFNDPAPTEKP
jgi:flagellar motility protein MotE (MotC chaperone)